MDALQIRRALLTLYTHDSMESLPAGMEENAKSCILYLLEDSIPRLYNIERRGLETAYHDARDMAAISAQELRRD